MGIVVVHGGVNRMEKHTDDTGLALVSQAELKSSFQTTVAYTHKQTEII
jgi:hypothetical protein